MGGSIDMALTAEKPVLEKLAVSPVFTRTPMEKLAETSNLLPRTTIPHATFTCARTDKNGRRIPQAIAHRGFKAKYPENTMRAFTEAVRVGAHALETDIHLSKDGVVVLSHDATLKRCFGKPDKIIDCDWKELSRLRTLKEPHEPMPRLVELLEFLAKPGMGEIWLLLDIKLDNDANDVMRLIAETIRQVTPAKNRPWNKRIVLGCWAAKFLPLCDDYLPDFPISHIGFSISYAWQFFGAPNVSFNMLQVILMGPYGNAFLRKARAQHRPVYDWTVNDEKKMRWSIRKELDGVITDDPEKFLDVCEEWEGTEQEVERFGVRVWLDVVRINVFAFLFMLLLRWRHGHGLDKRFVRRSVIEE